MPSLSPDSSRVEAFMSVAGYSLIVPSEVPDGQSLSLLSRDEFAKIRDELAKHLVMERPIHVGGKDFCQKLEGECWTNADAVDVNNLPYGEGYRISKPAGMLIRPRPPYDRPFKNGAL